MALKVWTLSTCPLLAISDKGATGSLWEISSAGSPRFFYMGATLTEAPLAVYYATTKLLKVTSLSELANQNTWLWGDYDSIGHNTLYVNTGESIETGGSKIVYRSAPITVIPTDSLKDRICFGNRISNNYTASVDVRMALYDDDGVYKASIMPILPLTSGELVDDNSKIAIPIGYKVMAEASAVNVSVLMSGDEF